MSRTALKWSLFTAALCVAFAVMLFFTSKVLQFEKRVADAEARAAVEENIRLALWRMDSTAALMRDEKPKRQIVANNSLNNNAYSQNAAPQQRQSPEAQNEISIQELRQRAALAPPAPTNWEHLEPVLLDRISDILPGATLEPVDPKTADPNDTRRLASIPARLKVPPALLAVPVLPWNTPLRVSLMIAWAFALIAAAAVAMLMGGALALSERRGAFVSAVTHELRTPLTTFRMYAEMLAGGMVSDPEARQQYLDTLVSEADRLGHLIENVLAYARLERQLSPSRAQSIALGELLERSLPGLRRRAQQAQLVLNVEIVDDVGQKACRTDTIAVQQILLNLVDNACKYGKSEIDLTVAAGDGKMEFAVADHGPGLDASARAKLFSPFSKSRTDSVPGIGLGLFLSRRLARALGGELRLADDADGATFILSLPM